MSYYYNYYLVKKGEDGLFYPLGPYDSDGKLECVHYKSRSFASDLYEIFKPVNNSKISTKLYESLLTNESIQDCVSKTVPLSKQEIEEYKKVFGTAPKQEPVLTYREALESYMDFLILPLEALPDGDPIKEGYVLASQIPHYEDDGFYPILTPHVYAEKLKAQIALGKPTTHIDTETGETYQEEDDDIGNFVYHKWLDITSREFDAWMIRMMADRFGGYKDDIYILETEG